MRVCRPRSGNERLPGCPSAPLAARSENVRSRREYSQGSAQSIGLTALTDQEVVGAAEGPGAEEAGAGRQRRRMGAGDRGHAVEHRLQGLRVTAPEDRHQRSAPRDQGLDRPLGDLLPAAASMRAGTARLHRQHSVQQQYALAEPGRQVAVHRRLDTQVSLQLEVDVLQRTRDRPHVGRHREGQPHGVTGGRIGILADDQHPYVGERPAEGPQHVITGRQVAATRRELGAEEHPQAGDGARDRLQRVGPVRADQLAQRPRAHRGSFAAGAAWRGIRTDSPAPTSSSTAPTPNAAG